MDLVFGGVIAVSMLAALVGADPGAQEAPAATRWDTSQCGPKLGKPRARVHNRATSVLAADPSEVSPARRGAESADG